MRHSENCDGLTFGKYGNGRGLTLLTVKPCITVFELQLNTPAWDRSVFVTKSKVSGFVKLKYFIHKMSRHTPNTVQPELSSDCEACSGWTVFDELCLETKQEIFNVHSVSLTLVRVVVMTS